MRRTPARVVAACLAVALATAAEAAVSTLTDCMEGSDFVANAARSRDNGMTRASFLDRLDADLVAIRAFPSELRWFARSPRTTSPVAKAARVYDRPRAPERHPADSSTPAWRARGPEGRSRALGLRSAVRPGLARLLRGLARASSPPFARLLRPLQTCFSSRRASSRGTPRAAAADEVRDLLLRHVAVDREVVVVGEFLARADAAHARRGPSPPVVLLRLAIGRARVIDPPRGVAATAGVDDVAVVEREEERVERVVGIVSGRESASSQSMRTPRYSMTCVPFGWAWRRTPRGRGWESCEPNRGAWGVLGGHEVPDRSFLPLLQEPFGEDPNRCPDAVPCSAGLASAGHPDDPVRNPRAARRPRFHP